MKKFIALLLALVMAFGLVACGGGSTPAPSNSPSPSASQPGTEPSTQPGTDGPALSADGRYPAETVKIGFVNYDPTAEQWLKLEEYFDYLSKYYNIEIMASEALNTAEGELDFIDACAAAGCDAVYGYYNVSNEQALLKCAEKGMYYFGQGANPAISGNDEMMSNPYYLGSFYVGNADYQYGYGCIEMLVEAGCHKIVGVSGGKNFGVQLFIDRWEGAMKAIEDYKAKGYDIELVYEVPGFPGTDGSFESGQTTALSMEGVDGIFSTLTALMWIQPMQEAGKFGQIKVAAAGETMSDAAIGMFGAGFYVGTATEIIDCFGSAIPVILNAVTGHADVVRPNGKAAMVNCGWWKVTNVEQAGFYSSIQGGDNGWAFTAEDIRPLLADYNPDVTQEDFSALYSATTMDEILARHQ